MDFWEPIIGLEIHIELKTESKMFCRCSAGYFGREPNTHCCPVCLGLPGALPVANKKAIEWTVLAGLALNGEIPLFSKFDRKNYFYPDLPKGYQISQYDLPLAVNGELRLEARSPRHSDPDVTSGEESPSGSVLNRGSFASAQDDRRVKTVRIRRVHLEEDTAKMIHTKSTKYKVQSGKGEAATLIDFNRSGVPLMEIVTEPDIKSPQEAKEFLKKLQQIIRYLRISDCDMEKGSMRCEANISLASQVKSEKLTHSTSSGLRLRPFGLELMAERGRSDLRFRDHSDSRNSRRLMLSGSAGSPSRAKSRDKVEALKVKSYRKSGKNTSDGGSKLRPSSEVEGKLPNYKVEIKNLNSFRFVERALKYEIERQKKILLSGKKPVQETRGWDEVKQITYAQRLKEEAHDYRYFPEPDLPPIRWTSNQLSAIGRQLPELPDEKIARFEKEYELGQDQVRILTDTREKADYFEEAVRVGKKHDIPPKLLANVIINKKVDIEEWLPAELIQVLVKKKTTPKIAEKELKKIVAEVIKENSQAVKDYQRGKKEAIQFLVGQTMKKAREEGNVKKIQNLLRKLLK